MGRTLVARPETKTSRARASRRRRGARRASATAPRDAPASSASNTTPTIRQTACASGAKLRHPSFGVGEVRAWQGSGNDLKVTMRFPAVGVKTILARFLTKP